MAAIAHPRIRPAEFLAMQTTAGWRLAIELIDGEAVVMPPTGGHAASVQGELYFALRAWEERSSADRGLLLQDVFVQMPGDRYLAPDIAWWTSARRPPLKDGALDVVPDLVVEILSPATRANDLGVKRELYVQAGARELWLADPGTETITRVRAHVRDEILGIDDVLSSELLPGFAAPIAPFFRRN